MQDDKFVSLFMQLFSFQTLIRLIQAGHLQPKLLRRNQHPKINIYTCHHSQCRGSGTFCQPDYTLHFPRKGEEKPAREIADFFLRDKQPAVRPGLGSIAYRRKSRVNFSNPRQIAPTQVRSRPSGPDARVCASRYDGLVRLKRRDRRDESWKDI